jgi:hypothetical protein
VVSRGLKFSLAFGFPLSPVESDRVAHVAARIARDAAGRCT